MEKKGELEVFQEMFLVLLSYLGLQKQNPVLSLDEKHTRSVYKVIAF